MFKLNTRRRAAALPTRKPLAAAMLTAVLLAGPALANEPAADGRVQVQLAQSGNISAAEIATQRSLLSNLSASVAAIEQRNNDLEAEVERLKAELAAAQSKLNASNQGSQAEIDALKTRIADQESEMAAARAAVETARQDVSAARADLAIRNQSIVQMDQNLTALRSEMAEKNRRIAELEESLAASRKDEATRKSELATATAALAARTSEAEARQKRIAELERTLGTTNGELDASKKSLQTSEQSLAATRKELSAAQSDLAARDKRIQELEAAVTAAKGETSASTARADKLDKELESLRNEVAERERVRAEQERQVRIVETLPPPPPEKPLPVQRFELYEAVRGKLGEAAGVEVIDERLILPADSLFERGSDLFSETGLRNLRSLADTLKTATPKFPRSADWVIRIDAHTDNLNPASRFPDNQDLSTARAQAVMQFLVGQGVEAARLSATGYADKHPIDSRTGPSAQQRNRRIEMRLAER